MPFKTKKAYFTINEIAEIINEHPNSIRNWQKQFQISGIQKVENGKIRFTEKDLNEFIKIQELVKLKKYSIEGAKQYLSLSKNEGNNNLESIKQTLMETKKFLVDLHNSI